MLFGQRARPDGRLFLVLIHLALGGFLFHFMTLPDRSVTLRILVELAARARAGAVARRRSADRYGVRTMIASRLEQLSAASSSTICAGRRIDADAARDCVRPVRHRRHDSCSDRECELRMAA